MHDMEEIYTQHFYTVYRYLRCLTGGNESLAEELCQETFFQAVKSVHRYREECAVSTWLCQIARHVWLHDLKKKQRHQETSLDAALENDSELLFKHHLHSGTNPEKEVLNRLHTQEALNAIQLLDAATREVLLLRLTGELSFREIGEITGHTENWARVTFFRGRKKIKEVLEHDCS